MSHRRGWVAVLGQSRGSHCHHHCLHRFLCLWWTSWLFPHPALPIPVADHSVCSLWLCFLDCWASQRESPVVCWGALAHKKGLQILKQNLSAKILKTTCSFTWLMAYICVYVPSWIPNYLKIITALPLPRKFVAGQEREIWKWLVSATGRGHHRITE